MAEPGLSVQNLSLAGKSDKNIFSNADRQGGSGSKKFVGGSIRLSLEASVAELEEQYSKTIIFSFKHSLIK